MKNESEFIFKILTRKQWEEAQKATEFAGAAIDLTDGYIHLSTASQLPDTLAIHFVGQLDLILLTIETALLQDQLKWEPSRGGELFPHLYSTLNLGHVKRIDRLSTDSNGRMPLPTDLFDDG